MHERIVSLSTAAFDGHPMADAVEETARAGFTHIEPAFIRGYVDFEEGSFAPDAAKRLKKRIADAGLKALAVSAHIDLSLPDARAMLARRIGFAGELGASFLITNSGPAKAEASIAATLAAVGDGCRDAGIVLALENPGHGTGDLIGNGRDGAAFLRYAGLDHVCLNYDVGNVFTYSRERILPQQDLSDALGFVGHVHLKDVTGRGDDWVFTALGEGDLDFDDIGARLPATLPLSIELPLRLHRPGRGDPVRHGTPVAIREIRTAIEKSLTIARKLPAP